VGLPPSPVEFSSLHHSYKLSRSLLLGTCHHSLRSLSSQAQLVYLQFRKGFPSPALWCSVCLTFFAMCLYYSYCLSLSFLFSLGGGRSVQGAMLIWPRVVCGSTVYHLAHLVHVFPSRLGTGDWQPGGPPGFSI
jgi:hypothetical protein